MTASPGVGAAARAPFVAWEFQRDGLAAPNGGQNSQVLFSTDPGEGTQTISPAEFTLVGLGTSVPFSNVDLGTVDLDLFLGDFTHDGFVNQFDLGLFIPQLFTSSGGPNYDPEFDLNADASLDVNQFDLGLFIGRVFKPVLPATAVAKAVDVLPLRVDASQTVGGAPLSGPIDIQTDPTFFVNVSVEDLRPALAAGNTNPQGIADPPAAASTSTPADGADPATATASAEFPTFTSFFTSDTGAFTSSITADEPVVLTEMDQASASPNDDGTTNDVSDDRLTDEQPYEKVAIDDKTINNLFANFEESLMDDLLAV